MLLKGGGGKYPRYPPDAPALLSMLRNRKKKQLKYHIKDILKRELNLNQNKT